MQIWLNKLLLDVYITKQNNKVKIEFNVVTSIGKYNNKLGRKQRIFTNTIKPLCIKISYSMSKLFFKSKCTVPIFNCILIPTNKTLVITIMSYCEILEYINPLSQYTK